MGKEGKEEHTGMDSACAYVGVCARWLIDVPLPFFLSQSHSYNTGQPTQDARHAVQIVDSTGVLDSQAGCQDGLHVRKKVNVVFKTLSLAENETKTVQTKGILKMHLFLKRAKKKS